MKLNTTYSNRSDEEVIDIYRNNAHYRTKQQIETYFYQKYLPLFKALSRKFYYAESVEDNIQECYLKMVDILEDAELFIEGNTLGGKLKSTINSYLQWKGKYVQQYPIEEYIETGEEKSVTTKRNTKVYSESFEDSLLFKIHFEEFKKQLTPKELKLVELLDTNMMMKNIAEEMEVKHTANLAPIRSKLGTKYIEFMNNAGYNLVTV